MEPRPSSGVPPPAPGSHRAHQPGSHIPGTHLTQPPSNSPQEKPSAVDQVLDFLLDCLPFPDSEEEVEERMEEVQERSESPFSSNLAHTADATQVGPTSAQLSGLQMTSQ